MQTVVKKWGNSLALRLPSNIAADLRFEDGTTVEMEVENQSLVIRPTRKRYRLSELLAKTDASQREREVDWGGPEGEEAW